MEKNDKVKPNDKEMKILRDNFPACFHKDGSFDLARFKEYLKDNVEVNGEGYELRFLGKNYARLLASLDTMTVIEPDEVHNSKQENKDSKNVYISGDNLDALKHLSKSYSGQVKCIYIDPPYNTGSDGFVYNDKFNFTVEDISEKLSITTDEAQRILDLSKRGSASHSAWLMFMYPRLQLARDLLKAEGVIFISIDDNEQSNLKLLCDDIYGEENFIAEFPRVTKRGGKSSDVIALNHDYVIAYSKTTKLQMFPVAHNDAAFKYKDEFFDARGYYKLNQTLDYDSLQYSSSLDYPIVIDGETFYPGTAKELYDERKLGKYDIADWAWRWSEKKFKFGWDNGFVVVKKSRNGKRLYTKTYQKAFIEEGDNDDYFIDYGDRTKSLSTLAITDNTFSNDNATKDIAETIGKKVFEHTKPLSLMMLLVRLCTKDDIILDFFSGSASTAEAIMTLNVQEKSCRQYILIQLPEECKVTSTAYAKGYRTICDIGIDRIKKAASLLRSQHPDTTADLGFKHYTLKEPPSETLDELQEFKPEDVGIFENNNVLQTFGLQTVLTTWLEDDGFGLSNGAETLDFADYTAYSADKYLYLINPGLTKEAIEAIVTKCETDGNFNPENMVLFGYSFAWTEIEELKVNLKRLKDTNKNLQINFSVRY